MREHYRSKLILSLLIVLLVSLFPMVSPVRIFSPTVPSNNVKMYFDSVFSQFRKYNKTFTYYVDEWNYGEVYASWKIYCEVLKYNSNPRYVMVYIEHWKARWNGCSAKEIRFVIKLYWSGTYKDYYVVYHEQYKPSEGKYDDRTFTTFTVGIDNLNLSVTENLSPGNYYQVEVEKGACWIMWEHTRTVWGSLLSKNIFTSMGKLKWIVIFDSQNKSATLNMYIEIQVGPPYDLYSSTYVWHWTNIYTYTP